MENRHGGRCTGPVASIPTGEPTLLAVPSTYQMELDYRGSYGTTANFSLFVGLRLSGPFESRHAERALNTITARHDVLRMSLQRIDGQIMQVVSPLVDVPLQSVTLGPNRAKSSRQLTTLIRDGLERPFDLARSPLFRAMIIRLGPLDHVLGLVVPHTIWDSACRPTFTREFVSAYDAAAAGAPLPPEPAIQIGDFAHWQRTRNDAAARAYWERQLAGAPVRLGLPFDEKRGRRSYRVCELSLPAASRTLTDRLQLVSTSASGMLAMTLTAATAVLLSAHAGRDDVTMALMHANRDLPETRNLLGFVADVLPLRVSIERHRSFRDTVHHVVDATRDAYRHMLPSGQLQDLLAAQPEVMVNPQQLWPPTAVSTTTGLRVSDYQPENSWTMHPTRALWYRAPIDVDFRIRGDRTIASAVSYNADALDDVTGRRLATHLQAILKRAAVAPDRSIERLLTACVG